MKTESRSKRVLRYFAVLTGVVVLLGLGFAPLLRVTGSFLVVEDPLRPAAAIVVLGGQTPFREIEAAQLYRDGWAPLIVVVRHEHNPDSNLVHGNRVDARRPWESSREALMREGVPASAIWAVKDDAESNRANR